MVVREDKMYYRASFSIAHAMLEKIVLEEMVTENWSSVLICEERKQVVVPKLYKHW